MRHASVTFDPAAAACDMPTLLSTQRPRHATCQRHFRPSGLGASADAGEFGRVPEGPPAGRVGAYCIRPTKRPGTGRTIISGVHPFGPVGPFDVGLLGAASRWFVGAGTRVGAYCIRPTGRHHRWRIHVPGVWSFIPCGMFGGAYAIRPYTGTCICPDGALRCWGLRPVELFMRLGVGACTRPNSPASADARWGVCWASSRRPTRGERRRRRGLHSARSAGC